jgi:hypothetical protein
MRIADNNTEIVVTKKGAWELIGQAHYPLENVEDFYRVDLLLELPFESVKSELKETARRAGFPELEFPYSKLVESALLSTSRRIVDQAMEWVPHLNQSDLKSIASRLNEIRGTDWASQRARQLANKFYKRAMNH